MTKFVFGFYGLPLSQIIMTMCCLIMIWNRVQKLVELETKLNTIWKIGNGFMLCGTIVVITAATLLERNGSSELILVPFHSLVDAQTQPELYRSMLMNIFLFHPIGLTLPSTLSKSCRCKLLSTIAFAFLLSFTVEFLQYYYHLGRAETDDVICNTLGAVIGSSAYWIGKRKNLYQRN